LTCAAELIAGRRRVLVLEASDGVGGRVRTDRHPDGYLLDRGYQVLLDAYPGLRRHANLPALDPRPFDNGAHVWTGAKLVSLADPFRHPSSLVTDLTTGVISPADELRLARLAVRVLTARWESAVAAAADVPNGASDRSAYEALRLAGFGGRFVDRFARPFWGGIVLDRSLSGSAGPLLFTLKMFLRGHAVLPAAGCGALAEQLAHRIPVGAIEVNTPVEALVREGVEGRVVGVRAGGETIRAAAVVVAADPPTAKRLTGLGSIPDVGVPCFTAYLGGRRDPGLGKRLALDGTGCLTLNDLAPISAVAPSYAPPGHHLLAASTVGETALDGDEEALAYRLRLDAALLIGHDPAEWTVLRTYRVPFAQFAQPPGIHGRLPMNRTGVAGLYLAGEATVDSSQNGAVLSGGAAARAVLDDLKRR
jgi:phytoene dehydrogenase-like protein